MKTLCVLLLVFAANADKDEKTPRKQSTVAPSLKELTKEEEAKIESVIERFIRADVGRVKGPEGKQALKDFEALPPEAIPALIHALNTVAKANQSCPVLMITRKLSRLLLASEDQKLLEFARDEIGADGALRSNYGGALNDLRVQILIRKNALARAPKTKTPEPKGLSSQSTPDLVKLASTERSKKLEGVIGELSKRDGKEALGGLVVATSSSDYDVKRLARAGVETHLGRLTVAALSPYLDDSDAELRRAAVRVAVRHARLVPQVIDRVEDDVAEVRAEARGALASLGKGVDFGPAATASREERAEAKKKWLAWWQARK